MPGKTNNHQIKKELKMIKSKFLYLLAFLLISAKLITPQQKAEGLVINEVFLNKDNPSNNWVEIYNPTKETLFLEKFSLSTISPENLLDKAIVNNGGIKLNPDDYILLCCEQNKIFSNKEKVYYIKYLDYLSEGGIISIKTKDKKLDGVDILRYGNSSITSWTGISEKQVVPLVTNVKSYSRKNNSKKIGDDFYRGYLYFLFFQ